MRGLLLARIAHVRCEDMIESLAVNVLGVRGKVCLHRRRQITVGMAWSSPRQPDPGARAASHLPKKRPPASRRRPSAASQSRQPPTLQIPSTIQAFLIAIFFSLFCACSVFGIVTVSTPFLKFASILSASMPSGTPNERWNEP